MRIGKGDIRSQRQRRRDRYRGCRVCGVRGVQCTECGLGEQLVTAHGPTSLVLVVDGSFVASPQEPLGHGGAGLVLVLVHGSKILASRACGFRASSSSDAEFHAVIRAARWAPGVPIYTDARELPAKMARVNPGLAVHYLGPRERRDAYVLAHRLSIEGRCLAAPETTPPVGIEVAAERPKRTRAERRRMGAELLLARARRDPSFNGDFTLLAEQLGWTSGRTPGRRWQDNPAIRIATERWLEQCTENKTEARCAPSGEQGAVDDGHGSAADVPGADPCGMNTRDGTPR